ncbi:MAG: hypothetical protein HY897_11400 [Deltaproteobacteria bacterium]|nr:hypothetical protein [Deltaproteobacteria bacterium]
MEDRTDKTLRVGAAKIDITPHGRTVNLAGFGFGRRSTGVLDPLFARAIHISHGGEWVVLVSADLIGLFRGFVEGVRTRLRDDLGDASRVLVCCTHNHDGPDTMGYWGRSLFDAIPIRSGADPAYMEELGAKIAQVVRAAKADALPVAAFRGRAVAPPALAENVRRPGHKDDALEWLRFDGPDGSPKAHVLNFACHPEALWSRNTLLSADYPGVLCGLVEQHTGGTALFFSGALGGMVTPNMEESASLPDRRRFMESMGRALFERLLESEGRAAPIDSPAVRHARRVFSVPVSNRVFRLLGAVGVLSREGTTGRRIVTETHMVRIGDALLFGAPGELLPSMGFMLKAGLSRSPAIFTLGLCCDELGYILAPDEFGQKTYRFERSMSVGTGLTKEVLESAFDLAARVL